MQEESTPYVFMSYSRTLLELGWARPLRDRFEKILAASRKRGVTVWMDDLDMPKNEPIREETRKRAREAAAFMLVLNLPSASSPYCLAELEAFLDAADENRSRVFILAVTDPEDVKRDSDSNDLILDLLDDHDVYSFWKKAPTGDTNMPLPPDEKNYDGVLWGLAGHIWRVIQSVKQEGQEKESMEMVLVSGDEIDEKILRRACDTLAGEGLSAKSRYDLRIRKTVPPADEKQALEEASRCLVLVAEGNVERLGRLLRIRYNPVLAKRQLQAAIVCGKPERVQAMRRMYPDLEERFRFQDATNNYEDNCVGRVLEL